MISNGKILFTLSLLLSMLLVGCGADSGGDRPSGVEPGPPPSGGNPPPPPTTPPPTGAIDVGDITATDKISVAMTAVDLNSPLTVTFSVLVNDTTMVTGLTSSNARFTLAKLVDNPEFSAGQSWMSYINRTEDPICRTQADVDNSQNDCTTFTAETDPALIDDSARKVDDPVAIGKEVKQQATSENRGEFIDREDGQWSYLYMTEIPDAEANTDVHRACVQFSFNATAPNVCVDFVPADTAAAANGVTGTSLASDFYDYHSGRKIVTEATCNTCHAELAFHGARTQTDYCVTCHNPGSTDANSGNSVDFKQMVHKIHYGRELPSFVDDGIAYKIWGFRNSEYDYSKTSYPQDAMTCSRCHAGEEDITFSKVQGVPEPEAMLTLDGHNWVTKATKQACSSCHEKLFTDGLKLNGEMVRRDHSGFTDQTNCVGCHSDNGAENPGSLQANQAHRQYADEASRAMTIMIESITDTQVGDIPTVTFYIADKEGEPVDLNDPTMVCDDARIDLRMPYEMVGDYQGRISAGGGLTALTEGDDLRYSISPTAAIPDEVNTIAAMIDFNYSEDCGESASSKVRLTAAIDYAPVLATSAPGRREIVAAENCNSCHGRFLTETQYHSGLRGVNNPEACTACHNSEFATSDRSRELGVLVHSIHASGIREQAYGNWNEDRLQYPGDLADCASCHVDESYQLPLPLVRRPIKDTSSTYGTALAAGCAGCHDSSLAKGHMQSAGGALFNVDFESASMAVETCDVCHGAGAVADVSVVHKR